ncbi:MAG TPA: hypothetical protein VMB46_06950 [Methanomassiliicoccales archaeon]|nr:hypothetical protein [Methanomassiliicoccales archaeon]
MAGVLFLALLLLSPLALPSVSACGSMTRARDLGTLGGGYSQTWDMNNKGVVVGASWTADGYYHAFSWSKSNGIVDINPAGASSSSASAINDRGDIVGRYVPAGATFDRACLWKANGEFVDLGDLFGGYDTCCYATDINERGSVVGRAYTYDDVIAPSYHVGHAVMWYVSSGSYAIRDLGTLEGGSWAWAWGLNDWDEVVGMSATWCWDSWSTEVHAFKWSASTGMQDIWHVDGLSYDDLSCAMDINNRGLVAYDVYHLDEYGSNYIEMGYQMYRGHITPYKPIGTDPCYGRVVNSMGDAAGAVWAEPFWMRNGFVQKHDGRQVVLTTVAGMDCWAMSLNDYGSVAGTGMVSTPNGYEYHAVLWQGV